MANETRFSNGIDLEDRAIINVLMHPITGDVSTPVEGQLWYNDTLEALRLRLSASTVSLASGGGIGSLVEDDSPQQGGMLDVNNFAIGDGTRELLTWVEDGAAINQLEIENEAIGSGPILRATGDDTNVDLEFQTKGSGVFNFTGDITVSGNVDGTDIAALASANTGDNVQATESALGIAELATQAEVDAGADDLRMITSLKLDAFDPTNAAWFLDEDNFAADSNTAFPTQQSTKAYIATQIAGFSTYQGGYNAATDTPSLDDGSPIAVAVGDQYTVTTGGSFFTITVEVGDLLIAEIDSALVEGDWTIVNRNLDAATETVAGIAEIATQGETDTGTDDVRFVTPLKLATWSGLSGFAGYDTLIGDGAEANPVVTHNLGSKKLIVMFREVSSDEMIIVPFDYTSSNSITTHFGTAPSSNDIEVTIAGR